MWVEEWMEGEGSNVPNVFTNHETEDIITRAAHTRARDGANMCFALQRVQLRKIGLQPCFVNPHQFQSITVFEL